MSKVSGQAWIVAEGTPATPATIGMKVPEGHTLSTSGKSRVRLERGADVILVGPATTLSPRRSFWSGTTILQSQGQIDVEVEKRDVKHFSVETPLLAAIVKGTRFTVAVAKQKANVQVVRGLVEVTDFATGQTADLGPGLAASVAAAGSRPGLQISGNGPLPDVQQGSPRSSPFQADLGTSASGASPSAGGAQGSVGVGGSQGATSVGGSASVGGASAGIGGSVGGAAGGASVDAGGSVGASAGASVGGGGVSAGASAGAGGIGASAGASVGGGGVSVGASVDVGGLGASVGGALGGDLGGALGGAVGGALGGLGR